MNPNTLSVERLREAARGLPHESLAATREAALANIDETGLPTVRDEDWKYTDLSRAFNISNQWLDSQRAAHISDTLSAQISALTSSIDAHWLVIANGQIDLTEVQGVDAATVELFSDSGAPFVLDRPLADLNAALLSDGVRIRLSGTPDKAIGLLVIDETTGSVGVTQANIELTVDAECEVEIIEYQVSSGTADHYCNSIVSLNICDAATARYVRLQNRKVGHVQTGRLSVALGKRSRLDMLSVDLGGGLIRNDVDIDIANPESSATFNGLYLTGDDQHIDNHTRVDHRVGPAVSAQEYRGILTGNSRAIWNGKAVVHKGADGTDATQANHNLLLSERAEINPKPELEIYAEDVKCAHGTTVGQLDETALFYLRTRGLDHDQAKTLLVHAFAVDLISKSPVAAMAQHITDVVQARLAQLIGGES